MTHAMTDRRRMIELLAHRQLNYSLEDVLRLTCFTETEIVAAVVSGEIQSEYEGDTLSFQWEEVMALATRRWTPRMFDAAVRKVAPEAVPPLNRFHTLRLRLPLYQIRLLHHLADMESGGAQGTRNASDVLERCLLDVAAALDATLLEHVIPGFREATAYPFGATRAADSFTRSCHYCGKALEGPNKPLCRECQTRHEARQ